MPDKMPRNLEEASETSEQSVETTNEFEKKTPIKILVVEDQFYPQYNIVSSLLKFYGDVVPNFRDGEDIRLVRSDEELQALMKSDESADYDVVFLDNTLLVEPGYNPDGPLMDDEVDFDKDNVLLAGFKFYKEDGYSGRDRQTTEGYRLINEFKRRGIVVVGTSSANDPYLLNKFGQPDFAIDKMKANPYNSAEENSLNAIKDKVLAAIQEKKAQRAQK